MTHAPVSIVTGGNTGIGFYVAKKLLQDGYRVVLACRNVERGHLAVKRLRAFTDNSKFIEFMKLDLNDRTSIRAFANAFLSKEVALKLLVNNAAVYNLTSKPLTEGCFDQTVYVNFYGLLLLTTLLVPALERSSPARIVNVSSSLYKNATLEQDHTIRDPCGQLGLSSAQCYPISKLRVLMASAYLFKYELYRRDIEIVNVCPGFIPTTELARDSGFLRRYILYYIFPLLPFTSTMEQAVSRVFKACTDELVVPRPIDSPYTYMYIRDNWELVEFEEEKVKGLWHHAKDLFSMTI